jgi:hypothetical protein
VVLSFKRFLPQVGLDFRSASRIAIGSASLAGPELAAPLLQLLGVVVGQRLYRYTTYKWAYDDRNREYGWAHMARGKASSYLCIVYQ